MTRNDINRLTAPAVRRFLTAVSRGEFSELEAAVRETNQTAAGLAFGFELHEGLPRLGGIRRPGHCHRRQRSTARLISRAEIASHVAPVQPRRGGIAALAARRHRMQGVTQAQFDGALGSLTHEFGEANAGQPRRTAELCRAGSRFQATGWRGCVQKTPSLLRPGKAVLPKFQDPPNGAASVTQLLVQNFKPCIRCWGLEPPGGPRGGGGPGDGLRDSARRARRNLASNACRRRKSKTSKRRTLKLSRLKSVPFRIRIAESSRETLMRLWAFTERLFEFGGAAADAAISMRCSRGALAASRGMSPRWPDDLTFPSAKQRLGRIAAQQRSCRGLAAIWGLPLWPAAARARALWYPWRVCGSNRCRLYQQVDSASYTQWHRMRFRRAA